MATVEECEHALHRLAAKLHSPEGAHARGQLTDRSVSCHLTDLGVTFTGALRDGGLRDISQAAQPPAQIRLTMTSDDLMALTDGSLNLVSAWTSRRISIQASVFDLIRLRKLL